MKGTVHILDAGLARRTGHHFQMAAGLYRSFTKEGFQCRIHAHASVSHDIRQLLDARPAFTQDHYDFHSDDPYSRYLDDLLEGSGRFARELEQAITGNPADGDLLLLPTAGPRELAGVSLWLSRVRARPWLCAIFHGVVLPGASLEPGSSAGAVYRYVGKLLQGAPGPGKLGIGATTRRFSRQLREPMGIRVGVFPAPVWYAESGGATGVAPARRKQPPGVTFIGQLRDNYRCAAIPGIVHALHEAGIPHRCVIHLGAAEEHIDLTPYEVLERDGLATLVRGWVEDDAMAALLEESTVVVFPYDRNVFKGRLSAAMCTAVGHGRPCVVPTGTWLSEQLRTGHAAGVAYVRDDPGCVADAIGTVLARADTYVEQAEALAQDWRRDQSGEALVKQLVAWIR